ncbi:MAG: SDR family NAD(P)-dependent oxidoreductase [Actinomycetota bacterium]
MQDLSGKTAVITGAASGIGKAMAHRFAAAGMNVVMSDIEAPRLDAAVAEVAAHGTSVSSLVADVANGTAVDSLADLAFSEFDGVHVLCNNAGVGGTTQGGEFISEGAWEWVLGVNLWGVIHGHRAFVPRMVEQGEGHVVNTASMLGLFPMHTAYAASKWAVVGITHGLYNDMANQRTGIGVSCLCPGWVRTEIGTSDRNRPESAAPPALAEPTADEEIGMAFMQAMVDSGMEPEEIADLVHDAVIGDRFWIFSDPTMVAGLADQHASIRENRNPRVGSVGDALG